MGDAVAPAHARGVRVISRVDFSKVHRDVAEEHTHWCFVSPSGEPQVYNGLHSTCPSGPYYQERAFDIGEILDRYPVDGFFFNGFGSTNATTQGPTAASASMCTAGRGTNEGSATSSLG